MRVVPATRPEIVAQVGAILRSQLASDADVMFAMALMTRYSISAEELNR
jgi:hypothetical protein